MSKKILIIGGGLTGALLAIFLARRGFYIEIYEKRSDSRRKQGEIESQRTIAMSLSIRGLLALERAGIRDLITCSATPTYGRIAHDHDGNQSEQYYSEYNSSILTIDRRTLNETLINKLNSYKNVKVYFNHSLEKINFNEKICRINFNGIIKEEKYDYLFGADGVFSVCRSEYEKFLKISPQIQQLPIGYKEFKIPFSYSKNLSKSFVHVWPSKSQEAVFVALPSNIKEAFLVNIFCPNDWIEFFKKNSCKEKISTYLSLKFPALSELLKKIDENYYLGTVSNMYQVKSDYWNYGNSFLLLGDAIHAISPFYAMGMNLCFESCSILEDLINKLKGNISEAITFFQNERKKDTDAMQDLAYNNFFNLSLSTSLSYKNIWYSERMLCKLFSSCWKPEYDWIAFTNVPLSEVKSNILKQKNAMRELVYPDTGCMKYHHKDDISLVLKKHNII